LTIAELWALPALLRFVILEDLGLILGFALEDQSSPTGEAPDVDAGDAASRAVRALRILGEIDWKELFTRQSATGRALSRDPAGHYTEMDFETRDAYRSVIEEIAIRSSLSESEVSSVVLELAADAPPDGYTELRNHTLATILCTMALRREEVSKATWGDLTIQNKRVVMKIHGKGRHVATLDAPRPVVRALDRWRNAVTHSEREPLPASPLLRRIWKGGRIAKGGLSPDGVLYIVQDAAKYAGLGSIAPHDLRRSVAGALYEAEVPVDKISRLLRHRNIAVTEKYLNSMALPNEGAVLMSDLLSLEDEDWPGFE
jgi:integrase